MRFALVIVFATACAPAAFAPSDRGAVVAVLEAQRDAWNRADLAGYMAGYARLDELVFTSGGQIRRGWQTTFDRYKARYGGDAAGMGQLGFEILDVRPVGADGAVVLGRWRLTGTPAAGGGVFSVVLERRPEGWRIIHDHTSSDPVAGASTSTSTARRRAARACRRTAARSQGWNEICALARRRCSRLTLRSDIVRS